MFRGAGNFVGNLVRWDTDSTCTGLQLVNFWQDIGRDLDKGRIYIPAEDMCYFGYSEHDLISGVENEAFRNLIEFQMDRTMSYLVEGSQLANIVKGALVPLPILIQVPSNKHNDGYRAIAILFFRFGDGLKGKEY